MKLYLRFQSTNMLSRLWTCQVHEHLSQCLHINPFESISLENSGGYSWHSAGIRKFPPPYLVSYYTSQLAHTPMMQHAEQLCALFHTIWI